MNYEKGLNRLSYFSVWCGIFLFLILWSNSVFKNPDRELVFSIFVTGIAIFFIQGLKWIIKGFKSEST